jgi:hypothetical protein
MTIVELQRLWPRLAGLSVAAVTKPVAMQGVVLVVECASQWTEPLEQRASTILSALPDVDGRRIRALSWRYVPPTNAGITHSRSTRP